MLAWRGGYTEDVRLLKIFEMMGVALVPATLVAFSLIGAAIARLPPLIERRCDDVVQLLGEDWWDAVLGVARPSARRRHEVMQGARRGLVRDVRRRGEERVRLGI